MRGQRKPTNLKLMDGSAAKDPQRINKQEPAAPRGRPPMPDDLTGQQREGWEVFWSSLEMLGLESGAYLAAGVSFATHYAAFRQTMHEPPTVIGSKGAMMRNPAQLVCQQASAAMLNILKEFGLTACAKAKVQAEPKKPNDPAAEFIA